MASIADYRLCIFKFFLLTMKWMLHIELLPRPGRWPQARVPQQHTEGPGGHPFPNMETATSVHDPYPEMLAWCCQVLGLCKGSQRPGFIYNNTKLEKTGAYMDSLCLGIRAVEDFVSKGWRGGAAGATCLTWVEFLSRSLCWTGGWGKCWGQDP